MSASLHFIHRCVWAQFFSCFLSGMPRGAGKFHTGVPVSSHLKIIWLICTSGSILNPLYSSWKVINPPEWQRLSLNLDGLNQLLVSTGTTATVFLLEMLQVQMKMGMNCVKLLSASTGLALSSSHLEQAILKWVDLNCWGERESSQAPHV